MEIPKGYKQTEVGVIPEGWEVKKVSSIFTFLKTNTLSRDSLNYYAGEVKNVHYGDILVKYGEILNAAEKGIPYINFDIKLGNNPSYLQSGDIIMSDTAEDEVVGKSSEIINVSEKIVSGLHTMALRPQTVFAPKYLGYFFNSSLYHDQLLPYMQGIKVLSLSKSAVGQTYIIYPKDLNEQIAISSSLSEIDELIAGLGEQIDKKRQIKEGAMQQLLTGKTRLPGFSQPWVEKKLGDICEMASGGTPSSKVAAYYGGNINFLSISDMTASGKYIYSTEKRITELGLSNSSAKIYPPNTLMYAMYASLGKCAISKIETAVSQAILGFTLSSEINIDFLYYHFCFIEDIVKNMGQTGTQSNLSKGLVQEFTIVLPEIEEQEAIADVLNTMDDEIHQLEAERDKYTLIKQGMMQELLTGKTRLV